MITNGFAYLAFLVCFAGIVSSLERKYKDSTFFKYVPTPVILYVMCMLLPPSIFGRTTIRSRLLVGGRQPHPGNDLYNVAAL